MGQKWDDLLHEKGTTFGKPENAINESKDYTTNQTSFKGLHEFVHLSFYELRITMSNLTKRSRTVE